jgi:hypothetical protein
MVKIFSTIEISREPAFPFLLPPHRCVLLILFSALYIPPEKIIDNVHSKVRGGAAEVNPYEHVIYSAQNRSAGQQRPDYG